MKVCFLGTDAVTPTLGEDTASYLLNDRLLVDTGWCAALRLLPQGVTPLDLTHLVFTHLHHDHYLGLPQVLFYRWMTQRGQPDPQPLTLVGPAGDLELVARLTSEFLQFARFEHTPLLELVPLRPGDSYETPTCRLQTVASIHPVDGLCYQATDRESGAQVVISGDTAYHEALIELARGADLLIHEASHGAAAQRDKPNAWGHCGAPDAAEVARRAGVRRLALVHGAQAGRAAALAAAREIFEATWWPANGETVVVTRGG
ncbi:MAG: MBL fold metallo-hydrolase [Fimbriimonadaceae bacterium]|nr:MBL fold metallo-hydrolase [Fimbriimonadaceae bacterium]